MLLSWTKKPEENLLKKTPKKICLGYFKIKLSNMGEKIFCFGYRKETFFSPIILALFLWLGLVFVIFTF